jgi:hypothetical protein
VGGLAGNSNILKVDATVGGSLGALDG